MKNIPSLRKAHIITTGKALELNLYKFHIRAERRYRDRYITLARHLIAQGVRVDRMKRRLAA